MVVLVVAANTRVIGNPSIRMDQVMLQPRPCLHEFQRKGQSLVFMMIRKEFSQYRTPHGPQSSSQFHWQRSQSSSTYRDYNGGSTCQDDDSNNRPSGRSSYSRYNQSYQQESYRGNMTTPEDIISQRVTVSLNQNGSSLDQAVGIYGAWWRR